jgi:hypothetical protein
MNVLLVVDDDAVLVEKTLPFRHVTPYRTRSKQQGREAEEDNMNAFFQQNEPEISAKIKKSDYFCNNEI